MEPDECSSLVRLDRIRDLGRHRNHPPGDNAAHRPAGSLLQSALARHCGVPTLVKRNPGRFPGRRDNLAVLVGDLTHRCCTVGIRIGKLFLSTQTTSNGSLSLLSLLEPIMDREWNDNQPIYRQLRDRVVAMILDGVLKEGDPLPSVRVVAAEYRVNPLTVLKGYQQLVDEQLVESKRGRGMFINAGARNLMLQGERQKFLAEEWPRVSATIQRLGLTPEELLNGGKPLRTSPVAESNAEEE